MLKKRKKNSVSAVAMIVFALLLALSPAVTSIYTVHVISVAMISYLCVLSVYVLLGLCGQNSFAQAGLWGVGAYLAGNVLLKTGGGTIGAFAAAVCGTALVAFVLGFAFFRLKQYYFTFASIGLMTILNGVFMNWEPFSGGAVGMKNIPAFSLFGWQATTEQSKFYIILAVCAVATVLIGLLQVPEGRHVFPGLTVEENLLVGTVAGKGLRLRPGDNSELLEMVYTTFPRLKERRRQLAWSMSGGEQQMLAIGRALMGQPKLLMLDEPSMGLAPIVVEELFEKIVEIGRSGVPILMVEQNARLALKVSDRAYILERGRITAEGASADLLRDPKVLEASLGKMVSGTKKQQNEKEEI